jgi:hypothetical protein
MPENCGLHAGVLGPIETLARWKCIGRDLELLYKIGGGVKIEPELLDEYIRKGRRAIAEQRPKTLWVRPDVNADPLFCLKFTVRRPLSLLPQLEIDAAQSLTKDRTNEDRTVLAGGVRGAK